jgi:hypothetical protein
MQADYLEEMPELEEIIELEDFDDMPPLEDIPSIQIPLIGYVWIHRPVKNA